MNNARAHGQIPHAAYTDFGHARAPSPEGHTQVTLPTKLRLQYLNGILCRASGVPQLYVMRVAL